MESPRILRAGVALRDQYFLYHFDSPGVVVFRLKPSSPVFVTDSVPGVSDVVLPDRIVVVMENPCTKVNGRTLG